jgi:hypothetical protein
VAVGNQLGDQIDQEVDGTAMARMLDLADVLQLIIDRFNDGPLAQEQFVFLARGFQRNFTSSHHIYNQRHRRGFEHPLERFAPLR